MDVSILLGSKSDMPIAEKCTKVLDKFGVNYQLRVASAHRSPKFVEDIIHKAEEDGCKVFIAMAGLAAALPGAVAALTTKPVIGVPCGGRVPFDSLLSIVQLPPGVPMQRPLGLTVVTTQVILQFRCLPLSTMRWLNASFKTNSTK